MSRCLLALRRAGLVLVALIALLLVTSAVILAASVSQADPVPIELMDMIDTLLRLSSLALMIIPVTEVRRIFGGLPSIPLPGGNEIRAGRWVSWIVTGAVLVFGHTVGWLTAPDFANFQAWFAIEMAIAGVIANIVYSRWWKEQIGLDPDVAAALSRRG